MVGDAVGGADRAACSHPRGRGAPRRRQQPGPRHRPARNRRRNRARRRNPHGLHAGVFHRAGTIERRDAAGELSPRRARRRCERCVLVDGRAATIAVGIRNVEHLVGHVENHDQQPADQLRSDAAIGIRAGVLTAAAAGIARSTRRGINTPSPGATRAARICCFARPSSRPWPP